MIKRTALLAVVATLSSAYFFQGHGWYADSRFALVRSVLEERRVQIDSYAHTTGDLAKHRGHYYIPMAPGGSLTAIPAVAAVRTFVPERTTPRAVDLLMYIGTLVVGALPLALLVFSLVYAARALGASDGAAWFAGAVAAFATPLFVYATFFWGHALVASCLAAAFACAQALRTGGSTRRDVLLGLAVGVAAGWATVAEYTAVVPAALMAGLALLHTRKRSRPWGMLAGLAVGAAACAVVLFGYNQIAFGSPFHTGYKSVIGQGQMKAGLHGVTYPKGKALFGLLFGPFRGLFFFVPVLAAAPLGLYSMWRRGARAEVVVTVVVFAWYLAFYGGFASWHGGWCFGPRYLAASMPFLALSLAFVWKDAPAAGRAILGALAVVTVAIQLLAVSTLPMTDVKIKYPLATYWRNFRNDKIQNVQDRAWNLGQRMGIAGKASLAPLMALWAAGAVGFWALGRKKRPTA